MPDYLGDDQRKTKQKDDKDDEKPIKALDEAEIALLKSYGAGPYDKAIKQTEEDVQTA
ncbi:unnamed protein product, partial [Rotaria magnacalcarata]